MGQKTIGFKAKNTMKFVSKPNTTQANRDLQKTATKLETNKQKELTIYSTTITALKLTAQNDIKHVGLLSKTIFSCKNSC